MADDKIDSSAARRRNWWMVAFFVLLFLFEGLREMYVLAANEPKQLMGPSLMVYGGDGFAHAEGVWARSDGGSPIVQNTVVINCVQQWNTCIEVNNHFMPETTALYSSIDLHDIDSFTSDAVTYSNLKPQCAEYRVRIDLAHERVIATRNKKQGADSEICAEMEDRVVMEMKSGLDARSNEDWSKDHFLPLVRVLQAFF